MTLSAFIIKSDKGAVAYVPKFGTREIGYNLSKAQLWDTGPVTEQEVNNEIDFLKKLFPAHSWVKYKISIY